MSLDQLLIQEDLNEASGAPYPNLFPNPSGGKRVVGSIKGNVLVRMNCAFLPQRIFEGLQGQSSETRCFFLLKDLKRPPFGCPMDLHSHLFLTPSQSPLVGLIDVFESLACQQLLTDDGHISLDLPLMFWRSRFRRIGHKSVVPFQLPISSIQGGIIKICLAHPGFQIVQDHRAGTPPKYSNARIWQSIQI